MLNKEGIEAAIAEAALDDEDATFPSDEGGGAAMR
jgi:hypothetical protein